MGVSNHILFAVIFLGLAGLYGLGGINGIQADLQNSFATLGAAWPQLNAPNCNLGSWNPVVSSGCAAANIAAPVSLGVALVGSFFNRIGAINTVANDLVFAPWANGFGIPFASVFFLGLMAIIGLELIRIFRGSSSGT